MIIDPTPNFVSRSKGTSSRLQPGGTYIANVTRVDGGQAYVTVPKFGTKDEFGPCFVVGIVPVVGDRVVVSFLNNMMSELVCLGTFTSRPLGTSNPTVSGELTAGSLDADSASIDTLQSVDVSFSTATGFVKNRMQFVEVPNGGKTLELSDEGKLLRLSSYSGSNNIVVPTDSVALPIGTEIHVVAMNLYANTISAASGVTLMSATGLTLRTRYSVATLVKYTTSSWHVFGDLAV